MADIIARGMANGATELAQEALTKIAQLPDGLNYKGAVNNVSDLPTNAKLGDCYTVVNDHNNEYAWGKKDGVNQWIILGPEMANVAYTGNYNDLTNKPTIPTVDVDKAYVDQEISKVEGEIPDISGKQDTLIPGENITIAADGKTISATGGGGSEYYSGDGIYIDEDNAINCDEQMIRDWQLQGAQDVNVMNDGGQIIFETIYGGGISREPGERFHQFTARPSRLEDNAIKYTQANDIEDVYGACMFSGIINNPSTEEGIEFFGDNGIQRDGDWIHFSCGMFLDQPLSFWYNTQTQVNELRLDGDWQGYTSLGALQLKRIAIQTQPIDPNFIPIDWDTIQVNDDGQLFANGGSQVSGTNDGTNWTSLTINDDTYAIPAGGSGGGFNSKLLGHGNFGISLLTGKFLPSGTQQTFYGTNGIEVTTVAEMANALQNGAIASYTGDYTSLNQHTVSELFTELGRSASDTVVYEGHYYRGDEEFYWNPKDTSYTFPKNTEVFIVYRPQGNYPISGMLFIITVQVGSADPTHSTRFFEACEKAQQINSPAMWIDNYGLSNIYNLYDIIKNLAARVTALENA